ncbi:MAG: RHS repeat-associated core domain-containing protein [Alicyclobacillus macrosporangiidus]|uniref:RHS repeat-associated core domain-containing protein n=1 Tax=Alicyclobacillus macrosporangiidus TaxID=392015 RepID=UPI0026E94F98|nr:RHS repeat-associated core domain-containing protein [Alicyclobacillus macrosporangiidus]MCL6600749.1 RHS repeat-associated core domain-containing protein [Alicyclobacillus macrosporangiidus]
MYTSAGLPVLWHYNGKEYGYVYDGLDNIIGLVDDTSTDSTYGTEVVTYTYDAWGNVLTHTDSTNTGLDTANPYIYRGYWYDRDTGLYYLNARYYNPKIGRFLSEDPVGPTVGDALSYNQYAYTRNNPELFADHTGNDVEVAELLVPTILTIAPEVMLAAAVGVGTVAVGSWVFTTLSKHP